VLVDRGEIASGQTAKAFGGVRQQFSTAPEVMLARESLGFFEDLGEPFFRQVGYLFVATSEDGLAALTERCALQEELGVPVEQVDPARIRELAPGVATDDLLGGVFGPADGLADPAAVARELVRRAASLGVEVREHTDIRGVDADVRIVACGPWSGEVAAWFGADLPIRPLIRQLIATAPIDGLPERLPLVIESETGFHFRRRDEHVVIAMADDPPRWGPDPAVDGSVIQDRLDRLGVRFPSARGVLASDAWAGLYDMTPDAHPIVDRLGDGLFCACGFSGHGFMQSPAVGRAVSELVLDGGSALELTPFRHDRFDDGSSTAEHVVL
jgi:sarcosine oxidase subunit beta